MVEKTKANAFTATTLASLLTTHGIDEILLCGMQTQNCVGLTAISADAKAYQVTILGDCCTAETRYVHLFALRGFGDLVPVVSYKQVLK